MIETTGFKYYAALATEKGGSLTVYHGRQLCYTLRPGGDMHTAGAMAPCPTCGDLIGDHGRQEGDAVTGDAFDCGTRAVKTIDQNTRSSAPPRPALDRGHAVLRHLGAIATTASGDSAGIAWPGAAWLLGPRIPDAPCPSHHARDALIADVLASAMQAAARGSERAAVLLQNYSHRIMVEPRPLGWNA